MASEDGRDVSIIGVPGDDPRPSRYTKTLTVAMTSRDPDTLVFSCADHAFGGQMQRGMHRLCDFTISVAGARPKRLLISHPEIGSVRVTVGYDRHGGRGELYFPGIVDAHVATLNTIANTELGAMCTLYVIMTPRRLTFELSVSVNWVKNHPRWFDEQLGERAWIGMCFPQCEPRCAMRTWYDGDGMMHRYEVRDPALGLPDRTHIVAGGGTKTLSPHQLDTVHHMLLREAGHEAVASQDMVIDFSTEAMCLKEPFNGPKEDPDSELGRLRAHLHAGYNERGCWSARAPQSGCEMSRPAILAHRPCRIRTSDNNTDGFMVDPSVLQARYSTAGGTMLCGDTGIGKTALVLTMIWHDLVQRRCQGKATAPTLIVTSKGVVGQTLAEARHFTPSLRTRSLSTVRDFMSIDDFWPVTDVFVLNAALITHKGDACCKNAQWLASTSTWGRVVIDDCHNLLRFRDIGPFQVVYNFFSALDVIGHRWAVSATPFMHGSINARSLAIFLSRLHTGAAARVLFDGTGQGRHPWGMRRASDPPAHASGYVFDNVVAVSKSLADQWKGTRVVDVSTYIDMTPMERRVYESCLTDTERYSFCAHPTSVSVHRYGVSERPVLETGRILVERAETLQRRIEADTAKLGALLAAHLADKDPGEPEACLPLDRNADEGLRELRRKVRDAARAGRRAKGGGPLVIANRWRELKRCVYHLVQLQSVTGPVSPPAAPKTPKRPRAVEAGGETGPEPKRPREEGPSEHEMCTICFAVDLDDPASDICILEACSHRFCHTCAVGWYRTISAAGYSGVTGCPQCRGRFAQSDTARINQQEIRQQRAPVRAPDAREPKYGSKFTVLIDRIAEAKTRGDKVVVFSQHERILDGLACILIEPDVARRVAEHVRVRGTVAAYTTLLARFRDVADCGVALVSLDTDSDGISLQAANRAIIIDVPRDGKTTMADRRRQALGRVDRMGQTKEIIIETLLMRDSIED